MNPQTFAWLPAELLDRGISLHRAGIPGIAWNADDAVNVIRECRERGFAILGGDLWLGTKASLATGSAGWACDPRHGEAPEEYVERSAQEATAFVKRVHRRSDLGWLFELVVAQVW